jgi:hypothetical protein
MSHQGAARRHSLLALASSWGHLDPSSRVKACTRSLAMLFLFVSSCSGPAPVVDGITIANPTAYDLDVEVTDEDRDGWLPVAIVEAESEDIVPAITDQGEVWIFRFRHFGDPVGELSFTRTELERNGWRVEVPAEVEDRLQQLGRPTSEEFTGVETGGDGAR